MTLESQKNKFVAYFLGFESHQFWKAKTNCGSKKLNSKNAPRAFEPETSSLRTKPTTTQLIFLICLYGLLQSKYSVFYHEQKTRKKIPIAPDFVATKDEEGMRRRRHGRGTDKDRRHRFLCHCRRRIAIVRTSVVLPKTFGLISSSLYYHYRCYRGWGRDADAGYTHEIGAGALCCHHRRQGCRCLAGNMLVGKFIPLLFNFTPKQPLT